MYPPSIFSTALLRPTLWVILAFFTLNLATIQTISAQETQLQWSDYVNLSSVLEGEQATEPKIVADSFGNVHVFWSQRESGDSTVYYARKSNDAWQGPADIIAGRALVVAAAVDTDGYLHVLWYSGNILWHSSAHVSEALSPQAWSLPTWISAEGTSGSPFGVDIDATVPDTLLLAFGAAASADVFFVSSTDRGQSWSQTVVLPGVSSSPPEVASEVRLSRNDQDIYVTWVSRQAPRGWPGISLMYAHSDDEGLTWATQLIDSIELGAYNEDRGPFFPTVFAADNGVIHLTWAGAPQGERWFTWSEDNGLNWQPMQTMTVFNATNSSGIPGTTGFTDMVSDSAGNIFAVTTIGDSGSPRVAQWLDGDWSNLHTSPYPGRNCEDPRLAQTEGNRIHLVCVEQGGRDPADIWYVMFMTQAPPIDTQPLTLLDLQEDLPTLVATPSLSTVESGTLSPSATLDESARTAPPQQASNFSALSLSIISTMIFLAVVLLLRQTAWRRS